MSKDIEQIDLHDIQNEAKPQGNSLVERNMDLVGHISVEVAVQVGSLNISLDQLFSMKSGEVLKMNESLNTPVTLLIDNKAVAKGALVAVDDNFGVQILEITK
ncbi:MAG: flagellar motor switch protein FliN [Alteromonadaceae bacterium]|nr:MAG: flagellar motor switch protein FliN [Alteromonadaceae bacterium]